jgi:hypothetical protein
VWQELAEGRPLVKRGERASEEDSDHDWPCEKATYAEAEHAGANEELKALSPNVQTRPVKNV